MINPMMFENLRNLTKIGTELIDERLSVFGNGDAIFDGSMKAAVGEIEIILFRDRLTQRGAFILAGFLIIERKHQTALIPLFCFTTPNLVDGEDVDQLGYASLEVGMARLAVFRLFDYSRYPLLVEIRKIFRADSVVADEFLAAITNDGNETGINARILILIQGNLSLAGKGALVGSPLS